MPLSYLTSWPPPPEDSGPRHGISVVITEEDDLAEVASKVATALITTYGKEATVWYTVGIYVEEAPGTFKLSVTAYEIH